MCVVTVGGKHEVFSPLTVLSRASELRAIKADCPLDLFAAHRFLLTLLYWKADACGGVEGLRDRLLNGNLPSEVLEEIKADGGCFELFDYEKPFLQDPSLTREKKLKSIGSFFTELATGTNVAHFQHGDDGEMCLCLRCATAGIMRLVPWTQAGGSGLTPSVHNAPPITMLAVGANVATTLGLNLVPFPEAVPAGDPTWSGRFRPSDHGKHADRWGLVPYLEALTWNPRLVRLPSPERGRVCWRCGAGPEELSVGPMRFEKNENTKKPTGAKQGYNFPWNDPAAFYPVPPPDPSPKDLLQAVTTKKTAKEHLAFRERDLRSLVDSENPVVCLVQQANPKHDNWLLIAPCTDAANNKSFDIRSIRLTEVSEEALEQVRTRLWNPRGRERTPGWRIPSHTPRASWPFLRETRRLSGVDWGILSRAANTTMDQSPEAFDLFSGLYWRVRNRGRSLPSRQSLWLVLKLMAAAPAPYREVESDPDFNPLRELPQYQAKAPEDRRKGVLREYPRALPRGAALETQLREAIRKHLTLSKPTSIAWADLCDQLNHLIR
jgi:hypothetical protein